MASQNPPSHSSVDPDASDGFSGARHPVEPGAVLGVLGGGQLGAMFARAARRMGYRVTVWDPDAAAPAHREAELALADPFDSPDAFARFAGRVRAATYEWENVPTSLVEALEQRMPVRPSARVLHQVQNRLTQKTFLAQHGIPVVPFRAIPTPDQLCIPDEVGYPCLCKTATLGYDGKGQWRLQGPADLEVLRQALSGQGEPARGPQGPWIVERFMPFAKECSMLVVRGHDGERRIYPVVENVHEAGILRTSAVPAGIDEVTAARATALASAVVDTLQGVGVFCVELFLMPDGQFYVNEVAPRPHNSGHYTLDACTVSQFEQQVRALCGLPLGEVRLLSAAVMVNLIGEDVRAACESQRVATLLRTPGAILHLYGKTSVRPRRKMGHITILAEHVEEALARAALLQNALAPRHTPSGHRA